MTLLFVVLALLMMLGIAVSSALYSGRIAENTILLWVFEALAVIGAYVAIVYPLLLVLHLLNSRKPPVPEKKLDELIREMNEEKRWRNKEAVPGGIGHGCDTLDKL